MNHDYIDWNNEWSYPLQWMWESKNARWFYAHEMFRVDLAMEGKSCKNLYEEEILSNLNRLPEEDKRRLNKTKCLDLPEGKSFILRKAVQNRANQMAGGVDTYEYQITDPYMLIDDETEDLLAAKCQQDYIENHLEQFAPVFSRDLTNYGMTAAIVRYDQERDKNIIERINPKNTWWDTMYSSTGTERFRGYSRMISWRTLKKIIKEEANEVNLDIEVPNKSIFNKNGEVDKRIKVGRKKIRTLNDLDIYVGDLNKLAVAPGLQAPLSEYWEYDHDLRTCYNGNWYHTFATDPKAKTESGYNGDDVELTVMYDMTRKIEFKIINRRYVIAANKKAFRRKLAFSIYNPVTDENKIRIDEFCLDCPLKFQFEEWEEKDKLQFPISPVMRLLDLHDELCAWRAKRAHVSKILSILRIETNGADATSLRQKLNIMGVILDDIQGDINSVQFSYDYSPIDSQIEYLERTITDTLAAYDQFYALQSMGDRATAAESGMAVGAIAQGLATHQNAIMNIYADIARQCIANRVAYSPNSEFYVYNRGQYGSVTAQQMALTATVVVKPKLAKKVMERTIATNAMALLGSLKDILTPEGIAYLEEQALMGNVPRKMAQSFIQPPQASEAEIQAAQQQAQNEAEILKQNAQSYEANPIDYEIQNVQEQLTPDEVDQVVDELAATSPRNIPEGQTQDSVISVVDSSPTQEQGISLDVAGMTPETAGELANPTMM